MRIIRTITLAMLRSMNRLKATLRCTTRSEFEGFVTCGYDDSGNLYLGASTLSSGKLITLARLSYESKSISAIALSKDVYRGYLFVPSVQWDGRHMTISTVPQVEGRRGNGSLSIYQLRIDGRSAKVIGTTNLK